MLCTVCGPAASNTPLHLSKTCCNAQVLQLKKDEDERKRREEQEERLRMQREQEKLRKDRDREMRYKARLEEEVGWGVPCTM